VDRVSFIFEIGDDTVWSPSLRIGQIYVGYIRALEEVLDLSAGFQENASDMIRIDGSVLRAFVRQVAEKTQSGKNHPLLADQLRVVLEPAIVMLQRAGLESGLPRDHPFLEGAQRAASSMPC
jgi:hypothetical protein